MHALISCGGSPPITVPKPLIHIPSISCNKCAAYRVSCEQPNNGLNATKTHVMKTRILHALIALPLLLFAMSTYAADLVTPTAAPSFILRNSIEMERAVKHQINRYVIFPLEDEAEALFGTVEVQFVVNMEGRLVVTAAHSENQDLCDYVVEKLRRVQVGPNPSGLWKTSHMRFEFRAE